MGYGIKSVVFLISLYQKTLSPDHGICSAFLAPTCRFTPTCSQYAKQALQQHGWRGVGLALRRIGRCHPFSEGGHDPVPLLRR